MLTKSLLVLSTLAAVSLQADTVFEKDFVKEVPTWKEIVDNYDDFSEDVSQRNFQSSETLGFVTQFNAPGYDHAITFRGKFTLISPAWFFIERKGEGVYEIEGDQEYDEKWINQIKYGNKAGKKKNDGIKVPKIVPRFKFYNWEQEDYVALIHGESASREILNLSDEIFAIVRKYKFDGIVLEADVPQYMEQFIRATAKYLRERGYMVILVIPSLHQIPVEQGVMKFTKKLYDSLSNDVDYFALMTYDYSNENNPGPQSPINWITKEVRRLCNNNCNKLLIGMGFYGIDFDMSNGGKGEAIQSNIFISNLSK
jgi:chitinase domain-containing protein 1